jgi:hypothetical protein
VVRVGTNTCGTRAPASCRSSSDRDYFLASQERWPINHPPTVAAETCARTGWNCKIRSQMHQSMEGWIFLYRSIDNLAGSKRTP